MWPDGEVDPGVRNTDAGRASTGSEVAIVDDRVMSAAVGASASPNIGQLNVTKSSRVHVGPQFVKVNQTIHNTEVVKGRILGLEVVTPKSSTRLRCSILVFVCWSLVVAAGIASYLVTYVFLQQRQSRLDLDIKEWWYLRRDDWQAMPPYHVSYLELPVRLVLIGHTVTDYCDERYDCVKQVLAVQSDHLRRGWDDIGPNYLVSGDGMIFEGRGANVIGAMVRYYNSKSISVLFIGDYRYNKTRPEQFHHLNHLLTVLVDENVLVKDYQVMGHCQVSPLIISPGPNIIDTLSSLSHWNSSNTSGCLKG